METVSNESPGVCAIPVRGIMSVSRRKAPTGPLPSEQTD